MKRSKQEQAYAKELKRIKSFIRRATKRGYVIDPNLIPKKPKKVTEGSVRRLKKISSKYIYEKSQYRVKETGELVSAARGRNIERAKSARKAAETRKRRSSIDTDFWGSPETISPSYLPTEGEIVYQNVVDNLISRLSQEPEEYVSSMYTKKRYKRTGNLKSQTNQERVTLLSLIRRETAKYGREVVGNRIQSRADEIDQAISMLFYASRSEQITFASQLLAEIIKGSGLTLTEMEGLNTESESFEDWGGHAYET